MTFRAALHTANTHEELPVAFLTELVGWAKTAPDDIFARNPHFDIYSKVKPDLGPWDPDDLLHRRAVLVEVMATLAQFESDGNWREGVDISRLGDDTPENKEAGAWQQSYDSRRLDLSLRDCLARYSVTNGIGFQAKTKNEHVFAMEYAARVLRIDVKDPQRIANGPLYKDEERHFIRSSLRAAKHSIYPWLSRDAVAEYKVLLS